MTMVFNEYGTSRKSLQSIGLNILHGHFKPHTCERNRKFHGWFTMNSGHTTKYGQFLVDFANADSTENAVLSCFNNLQQNFSFPPDFYEMVKNLYPSMNVIAVLLSEADQKLLEQVLKKNAIISGLNELFKSINYTIEDYDPLSRTVSLMSLEWNRAVNGDLPQDSAGDPGDPDGGGFLQTLKLLGLSIVDGPVTIKIDAIGTEIKTLLGSQAGEQIQRLIEVGHVIEELIIDFKAGRYQELHLLAEEHREVIEFHHQIEDIQTDCRQILNMVIEGRPFKEIPALAAYVDTYNSAAAHRLTIGDDNCLLTQSFINERKYLTIKEVDGWLGVLRNDTAYCLIEFLKSEKSRKSLKKCRTCHKFFMARQPKIQKFCTKQCRLDQPNSI
jgi:hypothetical protein